MPTLDYLLKANLYALLFAGCYWLLLRRHTFFTLNRVYLLASVVLSLTLPLADLPTQAVSTVPANWSAPVGVIALPAVVVSSGNEAVLSGSGAEAKSGQPLDWWAVGAWLYGVVAGVLLLRLGRNVWKLARLIGASVREQREGYVLVQPNAPAVPTFSFFRYVVLNPADTDNDLILQHERVHVRQGHSLDVLAVALLRAVFWGCPALGLLDRALRELHEFLADRVAIRYAPNQSTPTTVEQYARFLVDYAFGVRPDVLTNGFFNPSLLKRRIQMMHQRATTRWALGKYVLVLPLAFALLAMTTAREEITTVFSKTITVSGQVTNAVNGKPLSGASVIDATTGKGTTTDASGRYKLGNVSAGHTLAFSFVGFGLKTVPVTNKPTINVVLTAENANELPPMGATSLYKSIKPNPRMPIRAVPSSETINGTVWTAVEEEPVFPTGIPGLMQYVAQHLRYPASAKAAGIEGDVLITFRVLPSGAVGSVAVSQAGKRLGGGCEEEAMRVVRAMPRWIPGRQQGKPAGAEFQIPIRFALEKKDKRTGQYEPRFKPLDTPIGDFPVARVGEFPQQLTTEYGVSALVFKADTLPQSGGIRSSRTITIDGKGPLGPLGDDKQPLFIIDGLPVDKIEPGRLDPNMIKSITVLKDAATKAMYGEKGKNGVIVITTKKP